jgi:hypothetical protein
VDRTDKFLVPSNRKAIGHASDKVANCSQLLHLIAAPLPRLRQ